jgi:hypothetical protein
MNSAILSTLDPLVSSKQTPVSLTYTRGHTEFKVRTDATKNVCGTCKLAFEDYSGACPSCDQLKWCAKCFGRFTGQCKKPLYDTRLDGSTCLSCCEEHKPQSVTAVVELFEFNAPSARVEHTMHHVDLRSFTPAALKADILSRQTVTEYWQLNQVVPLWTERTKYKLTDSLLSSGKYRKAYAAGTVSMHTLLSELMVSETILSDDPMTSVIVQFPYAISVATFLDPSTTLVDAYSENYFVLVAGDHDRNMETFPLVMQNDLLLHTTLPSTYKYDGQFRFQMIVADEWRARYERASQKQPASQTKVPLIIRKPPVAAETPVGKGGQKRSKEEEEEREEEEQKNDQSGSESDSDSEASDESYGKNDEDEDENKDDALVKIQNERRINQNKGTMSFLDRVNGIKKWFLDKKLTPPKTKEKKNYLGDKFVVLIIPRGKTGWQEMYAVLAKRYGLADWVPENGIHEKVRPIISVFWDTPHAKHAYLCIEYEDQKGATATYHMMEQFQNRIGHPATASSRALVWLKAHMSRGKVPAELFEKHGIIDANAWLELVESNKVPPPVPKTGNKKKEQMTPPSSSSSSSKNTAAKKRTKKEEEPEVKQSPEAEDIQPMELEVSPSDRLPFPTTEELLSDQPLFPAADDVPPMEWDLISGEWIPTN